MEQERLADTMTQIRPLAAPLSSRARFGVKPRSGFVAMVAVLMLAGCQSGADTRGEAPRLAERSQPAAMPGMVSPATDPAACWAQDRLAGPQGPEDRMFAVPCPQHLDPDTLRTLQRALAVRGLYGGEITGAMDGPTREAVRRLQAPMGLDSPILSLEAARRLGVVATPVR